MINAPLAVKNALLSGNFKYANLITINLGDAYNTGSDVILYYTDYVTSITHGGNTYTNNNSLKNLDGISRKASVGSDKLELSFPVADETIVEALRSERYINKPTIIERVVIENNTVLEDFAIPIRTAWGLAHKIEGSVEDRVCTLVIDSALGDLDGDNGWYAINSSHQRRYPNDLIMNWGSTVMTEEQQKRYTTNFNGVINQSVKPPALPVIYGERNAKLIPIAQLKHRKSHSTYRHYYTTWIYVVSIGDVVSADVKNIKKDGEKFQYEVITGTREDAGGWSLRVMTPSENTVSIANNNTSLLWFKARMDTGEVARLNGMIGKGLTLLFIKNRNRDDWVNSPPDLTMPVKGIRVYDPRTGLTTTTASRNPALQYADFLRSTNYGAGQRNISVSDANIIDLANHFDNLPESAGNPGINDIKFDVQMDTSNPLVDNMNIWMESLRLYTSDYYGEFIVNVQTIQPSVWDIDEYDPQVLGPAEFESGDFTDRINQLTYDIKQLVPDTSVEAEPGDLVEVSVEAVFPEDDSPLFNTWLAEDSGIQNFESESLDYITILEQAFYWTMVDARISRQPRTLILTVGSYGWLVEVGDVITYTSDVMEEVLTEWRVDEVAEDEDGIVELTCIAYASDFYSPDPNAIPDPVAPAQPPTKGILEDVSGIALIFENGENKLTWNKIDSSEVAWYAVEIWNSTETLQLIEEPKVLSPPYSLGGLGAGSYVTYITAFAPNIETQFTTFSFVIQAIDAPTIVTSSSNFEILVTPSYVNQSATTQFEIEYSLDNTFNTGVTNLGLHYGSTTIIGLTANTVYNIRARVIVPAGISPWTTVQATTANNGSIYNNLPGFDITAGKSVFQSSIYKRSPTPPPAPTTGEFDFDTLVLTPPAGWTQTPPGGVDPLYVSTGLASVLGTVGVDNTIPWSSPEELLQGGLGLDGRSVFQGALYQRNDINTPPTKPANDSATFSFTNNAYSVIPAGWFSTIPAGTGRYVWVTYATFSVTGDTGEDSTQVWTAPVNFTEDGESAISAFTYNVYKRSATPITSAPTGGSYNFTTNIIGPPTGWSSSIPTGTDPIYASTTTASITGSEGEDTTLLYTTPVVIAQNGEPGDTGSPAIFYRIKYPNGLSLKDGDEGTVLLSIEKVEGPTLTEVTSGSYNLYDGAVSKGYTTSFTRENIENSKVITLRTEVGGNIFDAVTVVSISDGEGIAERLRFDIATALGDNEDADIGLLRSAVNDAESREVLRLENQTNGVLIDAVAYVDPSTGQIINRAFSYSDGLFTEAEIRIDGVEGEINAAVDRITLTEQGITSLSAELALVPGQITATVTSVVSDTVDPLVLELDDTVTRVSQAELDIDANESAITQRVTVTEYNNNTVTFSNVEVTVDGLNSIINLEATRQAIIENDTIASANTALIEVNALEGTVTTLGETVTTNQENNTLSFNQVQTELDSVDGKITNNTFGLYTNNDDNELTALTALLSDLDIAEIRKLDIDKDLIFADAIQQLNVDVGETGALAESIQNLTAIINVNDIQLVATVDRLERAEVDISGNASAITELDNRVEVSEGFASSQLILNSNFNESLGELTARAFLGVDINNRVTGINIDGESDNTVIDFIGDKVRFLRPTDSSVAFEWDDTLSTFTFDGKISAVDSDFSGTITASSMVGGDITGSKIVGSKIIGGVFQAIGTNYMRIISGDAFGVNNLLEWYGAKNSTTFNSTTGEAILAGLNKVNGKEWKDDNGIAFTSGTIIAGTLTVSKQSSELTATPSVETGTFGSNGGQIAINCSGFASFSSTESGDTCNISEPTPQIIIRLYDISSGSNVLVNQQTFTGTISCFYELELNQSFKSYTVDGSFTYFDNDLNTSNREYRAEATISGVPLLPLQNRNQRLSILTQEA